MPDKRIDVACGCNLELDPKFGNVWIVTHCAFHASTPDLLAALKGIFCSSMDIYISEGTDDQYIRIEVNGEKHRAAVAAIAKAEPKAAAPPDLLEGYKKILEHVRLSDGMSHTQALYAAGLIADIVEGLIAKAEPKAAAPPDLLKMLKEAVESMRTDARVLVMPGSLIARCEAAIAKAEPKAEPDGASDA